VAANARGTEIDVLEVPMKLLHCVLDDDLAQLVVAALVKEC